MIYLSIKFINDIINSINLTYKLGINMITYCIKVIFLPFRLIILKKKGRLI